MGTDMVAHVEYFDDQQWVYDPMTVFSYRSYSLYAWLAGMKNFSCVPIKMADYRGLPEDVSPEVHALRDDDWEGYGTNWLLLSELTAFDYSQRFEDRRDDGRTLAEGQGEIVSYREFLPEWYFEDLAKLAAKYNSDQARIIFWFS